MSQFALSKGFAEIDIENTWFPTEIWLLRFLVWGHLPTGLNHLASATQVYGARDDAAGRDHQKE
jgi:hypothetical protein